MRLKSYQTQICRTQGRLFELAGKRDLDDDEFVKAFMNSETARQLDMPWSHAQWAGEAYLLAELKDEVHSLPESPHGYRPDAMYWMGYIYRYWHFYTGESSAEIYEHADASTMAIAYPGYHTLDCAQAIDRLLEDD